MLLYSLGSNNLFDVRIQYVLPPETVVYCGAVGDDERAKRLGVVNAEAGVESAYQVVEGEETGACAVVITGHNR